MSTYTQLQADVDEVASRSVGALAYRSLTAELNARLRLTLMESSDTITTVDNTESYSVPADFLEARSLFVLATPRSPIVLTTQADQNWSYSGSGRPVEAIVVNGLLLLNPVPDDAYSVVLRYIAKLADLSGGSDTNDVMDNHYNIYLYGALKHHTALTRNIEMTAYWGGLFEEAIRQAEIADMRKLYGAESLSMGQKELSA